MLPIRMKWRDSLKPHSSKLELLFSTFEKVFRRLVVPAGASDRVVYSLGRVCVEDFKEIFSWADRGEGRCADCHARQQGLAASSQPPG
jgi:hypothetical protein